MAILTANQLSKVYGHKQKYRALNNISFSVEKGEFVAVMGPSGSGKTTLLNVLSSIDTISGGTVEVEGKEINKLSHKEVANFRKQHLGFIFQDYSVLPTLTVKENIETGAYLSKTPLAVETLLDKLGLKEHCNRYPNQLSGGQQQRTAIGRALAKNPKLLLCDEPTGALDYQTGKAILGLLREMCDKYTMTVIVITHNSALAPMADRIIHLKNGQVASMNINEHPKSIAEIEW